MDGLRQYIFSIICLSLMSGIALSLVQAQGARAVLKLLCGAALVICVVSPLSSVDLGAIDLPKLPDAEAFVQEGENLSRDAMARLIKQECEAYILDKAASLNARVEVRIEVAGTPPVPVEAAVSGAVSPEVKGQIEAVLQKDLGISKEKVQWTG